MLPAEWDYMALCYSTESYGEHTQTCTFKTHANLLAYLANWPLYTLGNGSQGAIKRQGGSFLGFAQVLSALIALKNCQNGLLLKHYVYSDELRIDDQPMLN